MKKHLPILLIALGIITLICAVIIVSCTAGTGTKKEETSSDSETPTDTATVVDSTHLHEFESTNNFEQSSKTETTSIDTTEAATVESESVTLEYTESESSAVVSGPSLIFISNGNGTCTLSNIGDVTDTYISIPSKSPDGDVVTAIAEKAFYSNDNIKAIEIPSTVMSIGNMAFSNCRSLLYIEVDENNTMFKDINGVLFSSDLTELICYPSGSGMTVFDMPLSVKTISDMAFYNCSDLKTVIYPSTVEDWSKIVIGEQNYGLISAAISFK